MGGIINIGFGTSDITPRGGPISLRGQWETRVSDEIRDPLLANAMMIQSDGARTIWAACDLCGIDKSLSDEVKRLLRISLDGFEDEQLILSGTHIHTGPNTDINPFTTLLDGREDPPGSITTAECCRQVALGIEKAVLQAASSLEPGCFEVAISHTITGVCRRALYKNGSGIMYGDVHKPDFSGMEGRDGGPIQILFIRRERDKRLVGVVATVPCPAQVNENALCVTADYWATARNIIKRELGGDTVVLGLIRSAGDLSPHTMVDCGKLTGDMRGADAAVTMGNRIGNAIVRAAGDILITYGPEAVHKHAVARVSLPLWTASKTEYDNAMEYVNGVDKLGLNTLDNMMAYSTAVARIKRYELGISDYPANLYAVRIGDIVFITNPFELYIEYADRIRAACPEAQVYDVQLAGDDCLGYLPTQRAIDAGGYSAMIFSCFCGAKGGEEVVDKSVELIKSLMG